MTHEPHSIPWGMFAKHLHYGHHEAAPKSCEANLFARASENYKDERTFFIKCFLDTLEERSFAEKTKYSGIKELRENKTIISRATVHKIRHARRHEISIEGRMRWARQHPLNDTSLHSLLRVLSTPPTMPGFMPSQGVDLLKELLLHGEMDSLFKLLSHPRVDTMKKPEEVSMLMGSFKRAVEPALEVYICLNLILQKRELYDPEAKTAYIESLSSETPCPIHRTPDYRHTRAYQKTLLQCTDATNRCIPDRLFFGAAHHKGYKSTQLPLLKPVPKPDKLLQRAHRFPGRVPFEEFKPLLYAKPTLTEDEFSQVSQMLRERDLPAELSLYILDLADFTPSGLKVLDDPLHPGNAKELEQYLSYCWQLLVRVNALAQFASCELNWEYSIKRIIVSLFQLRDLS